MNRSKKIAIILSMVLALSGKSYVHAIDLSTKTNATKSQSITQTNINYENANRIKKAKELSKKNGRSVTENVKELIDQEQRAAAEQLKKQPGYKDIGLKVNPEAERIYQESVKNPDKQNANSVYSAPGLTQIEVDRYNYIYNTKDYNTSASGDINSIYYDEIKNGCDGKKYIAQSTQAQTVHPKTFQERTAKGPQIARAISPNIKITGNPDKDGYRTYTYQGATVKGKYVYSSCNFLKLQNSYRAKMGLPDVGEDIGMMRLASERAIEEAFTLNNSKNYDHKRLNGQMVNAQENLAGFIDNDGKNYACEYEALDQWRHSAGHDKILRRNIKGKNTYAGFAAFEFKNKNGVKTTIYILNEYSA